MVTTKCHDCSPCSEIELNCGDKLLIKIVIFPCHHWLQIKPLVGPTKGIMRVHITALQWQWHEFFPRGTKQEQIVIIFNILLKYFML